MTPHNASVGPMHVLRRDKIQRLISLVHEFRDAVRMQITLSAIVDHAPKVLLVFAHKGPALSEIQFETHDYTPISSPFSPPNGERSIVFALSTIA